MRKEEQSALLFLHLLEALGLSHSRKVLTFDTQGQYSSSYVVFSLLSNTYYYPQISAPATNHTTSISHSKVLYKSRIGDTNTMSLLAIKRDFYIEQSV